MSCWHDGTLVGAVHVYSPKTRVNSWFSVVVRS